MPKCAAAEIALDTHFPRTICSKTACGGADSAGCVISIDYTNARARTDESGDLVARVPVLTHRACDPGRGVSEFPLRASGSFPDRRPADTPRVHSARDTCAPVRGSGLQETAGTPGTRMASGTRHSPIAQPLRRMRLRAPERRGPTRCR